MEEGTGQEGKCGTCRWWQGRAYTMAEVVRRFCGKLKIFTEAHQPKGECSLWEPKA